MWRSEKNTFVRTTPASLDTQYSMEGSALPSPPLPSDCFGKRWFHVPGSSQRAAPPLPDGLVSSSLEASSSPSMLCTSSLPAPQHTYVRDTWRSGGPTRESFEQREVHTQGVQQGMLPSALRMGATALTTSDEISSLLRQYRDENCRLREQLRAKELQEAHLMSKMEELSRRYALLQLECQRASRDPDVMGMLTEVDENTPVWAPMAACAPPQKALPQLAQKEEEVRLLQVAVRELEGRVEAYREALQRARAFHGAPDASEPPQSGEAALHNGTHCSSGAPASLHALLLQSLSTADYLVKVFNALQHCQHTRHSDDGSCVALSSSSCPRNRQECTLRCLQAAMKGVDLPPDLRDLADGPENNTMAANVEAALAVREELTYCETVAVRLAAVLLGRQGGAVEPLAAESADVAAAASSPPLRTNAKVAEDERMEDVNEEARRSETLAEAAISESSTFSAIPARSPRTNTSRCRPDVEDCEVQ
ncbi:hypothetical protein ABL78_4466 [Leptomonas seymouri]|uniref:Uncharacterized protein n=1 Tax=Leptomonas seymouri TaxID=5684 RepID=A0A0N1IK83_LEPSE|nr:hypothetical protein ABL78_4466 [Leptomonas seymouri]|eukprot:KPI86482.1 hypothetical protein ABL78_4466 [Leptomonas seymouri]